jgi:hypothetical protein
MSSEKCSRMSEGGRAEVKGVARELRLCSIGMKKRDHFAQNK